MTLLVSPWTVVGSTKMDKNNSSMVVDTVTYSVDFSTLAGSAHSNTKFSKQFIVCLL